MSDDTSSDDMVAQFLAFTGSADPERAQSYLEMSGGDLQTAVGLYMEHQGSGGGGGPPGGGGGGAGGGPGGAAADMMGPGGGGGGADAGGFAGLGDGGGGGEDFDVRAPDRTRTMRLMDFDDGSNPGAGAAAALARSGMLGQQAAAMMGAAAAMGMPMDEEAGAMMSAFAASSSSGGGGGRGGSSSAPGSGGAPPDVREAINRAAAAAADAESGEAKVGEVIDIYGDDDGGGGGPSRRRPSPSGGAGGFGTTNLSDMFAPPSHLLHTAGGFQGARNVARDARRWLLVNLQRDADFACHALNRDVWRHELVENLVKEGFIFWQSTDVTADGSTYAQRYGVQSYPHVAIIDPRTGRLIWKKEGWTQVDPMTAEQFAEMATDFCSRHSFDRPPAAPRPPGAASSAGPGGASASASSSSAAAKKRPKQEMTEEEQLQAAIRASMQNGDAGGDEDMDQASDDEDIMAASDDEEEEEDDYEYDAGDDEAAEVAPPAAMAAAAVPLRPAAATRDEPKKQPAKKRQEEAKEAKKDAAEKQEEEAKAAAPPSFEAELLTAEVGDEPTDGDVARVQIRMPDGKRLVRKFRGDDTVRVIYAFVAQSGGEGARPFELRAGFPPRDIRPKVDETIKGCGLAGEAITARWTT